jgi:hypothetical protein
MDVPLQILVLRYLSAVLLLSLFICPIRALDCPGVVSGRMMFWMRRTAIVSWGQTQVCEINFAGQLWVLYAEIVG